MVFKTNNIKLGYLRQIGDFKQYKKIDFTKRIDDFPNKILHYKKIDISHILTPYNY